MDYQKIRDNDPGGTVEEAVAALSVLTEVVALDESRVNVRSVGDRYGIAAAEGIRQTIAANYPAWVEELYLSDGLDVCSSGTTEQINAPPFTAEQVTQLLSFQTEQRRVFPRIRYGDVEKARGQA